MDVTATGNSIQKTSGCEGCDAGATSQQQITSGDGYIEFTIGETNTLRYAGLGHGNTNANYADIDFAFRISDNAGYADIVENGVQRPGSDLPTPPAMSFVSRWKQAWSSTARTAR